MKYFFFATLLLLPVFAFAQENTSFIPLTNTPFIEQAGNAVDLENFLNQMYRLCIGIAAVVAVLQIMRAGIMYMGGDSITEKKEAKNLIALSIGGLILVLSPVIVFSIINPDILSLKIGGIENLRPASTTPATTTSSGASCNNPNYNAFQMASVPQGGTCSSVLGAGWANVWASESSCCGGTPGAGQVCCARSATYQPPPPNPEDSEASFSFIARDVTPGLPACRLPEETRGFDTVAACNTASQQVGANENAVLTKNCSGEILNPPTPAARWEQMRSLPRCET